ncbi:hypothetical protein HMN09_00307500 [Mycena chlorophos]|uniref:Uncharacterized protein n=1 Tax=Mycena chlorophos TaxID=658473 RepID=A0A8H6WJW0_MYCCL|nr:hypothetical protein HMN09_00307500 [Mycena chlorophos]
MCTPSSRDTQQLFSAESQQEVSAPTMSAHDAVQDESPVNQVEDNQAGARTTEFAETTTAVEALPPELPQSNDDAAADGVANAVQDHTPHHTHALAPTVPAFQSFDIGTDIDDGGELEYTLDIPANLLDGNGTDLGGVFYSVNEGASSFGARFDGNAALFTHAAVRAKIGFALAAFVSQGPPGM